MGIERLLTTPALAVVLALVLAPFAADNGNAGQLSPALQRVISASDAPELVPVVVRLTATSPPRQLERGPTLSAARTQVITQLKETNRRDLQNLKEWVLTRGGTKWVELWAIRAAGIHVPPSIVSALADHPDVATVELSLTHTLDTIPTADAAAPVWNMEMVNAPQLWARGVRGNGAVVAILDTGVDPLHSDLEPGWVGGVGGWFDPYGEHTEPADTSAEGHGTGAAGLAVGGEGSGTPLGVAPDSLWIAAKIFNNAGEADDTSIHEAFQWLLDPDDDPATDDLPDVVNNSWGFKDFPDECDTRFQSDILNLRSFGVAVVFAAGNGGQGLGVPTSLSPANNLGAISVGAVDFNMDVADISARGHNACDASIFPTLVAPGKAVVTADLTASGLFPDSYAPRSGTSFSAPHVAGAIALLMGAFPSTSLDDIEAALVASALDIGAPGDDNDSGSGILDVAAAFELLVPAGCIDNDGDGFFRQVDCGTPVDCDDNDTTANPGEIEECTDTVDNDCDGLVDTDDPQCPTDIDPLGDDATSTGSSSGGCFLGTFQK